MSKYRVFSGPYFPLFRLNTEIYSSSLGIPFEFGKYGPDKIPYLNTLHAKELQVLSSLSLLFNLYSIIKILSTEAHSEACQTCKVELFAKLVTGFQPLNVFAKCSILDVWLSSEYTCEIIYAICMIKSLQTISNIHPRIHKKNYYKNTTKTNLKL